VNQENRYHPGGQVKAPVLKFDRGRPDASRAVPRSGGLSRFSGSRNVLHSAPSRPVLSRSVANPVAAFILRSASSVFIPLRGNHSGAACSGRMATGSPALLVAGRGAGAVERGRSRNWVALPWRGVPSRIVSARTRAFGSKIGPRERTVGRRASPCRERLHHSAPYNIVCPPSHHPQDACALSCLVR
jgi:hypothetical protein